MPFDSAGTFTRVHNWEQDRLDGISIDSARVDEEMDDVASGLSKCMLRAGGQAMLNNLNMNSFKIQNVANGTVEADAVNKSQLDAQNTALTTAYQNYVKTVLGQIYPVGSVYIGTQTTCPLATLISGSTWSIVGTAIVTSVNSNVPIKGTGKAIGIMGGNGVSGSWVSGTGGSGDKRITVVNNQYNLTVNDTSYSPTDISSARVIGLATDASNSGIVGTITSSGITVNVWRRTK